METKSKEKIKEHVLLMLGHPVIKVDLSEEQIDLCIDAAEADTCAFFGDALKIGEIAFFDLVRHRAMIKSFELLGRLRVVDVPHQLGGKEMRKEAKRQNAEWHYKVDVLMRRHNLVCDGDPEDWWKNGPDEIQ